MKEVKAALVLFGLLSLLTGIVYPAAVTGIAAVAFRRSAGGSLIPGRTGIVGSALIGQRFSSPHYLHGRPSAGNYDGMISGGSNLGPTNAKLVKLARERAELIRAENGLAADVKIPPELVFASASGLDPHIGLRAARLQAGRIARARKLDERTVVEIVMNHAQKKYADLFGEPLINVLAVNRALDVAGGR